MASGTWLGLGSLVLGLAGGYLLRDVVHPAARDIRGGADATPTTPEPKGLGASGEAPALGTDVTVLEAATKRADAAEAKLARSEARIAQLSAELDAMKALAEGGGEATAPRLAVPVGDHQDVLAALEWKDMGTAAHEMSPHLPGLIRGMAEGRDVSAEAMQVGRRNVVLVTAAMKLGEAGLSGTGVNGAFTHPAVIANFVVATLEAAGLPLDEKQLDRLRELADQYVARERARIEGYRADALAFVKLVDETRLKKSFIDGIDALLSPAQVKVLHPHGPDAPIGTDLFSPGLLWQGSVAPAANVRNETGQARVVQIVSSHLKLDPETAERVVRPAVVRWTSALPGSAFTAPSQPEDRMGLVSMARLDATFDAMRGLYESLLADLPSDHPSIPALRTMTHAIVPVAPYE